MPVRNTVAFANGKGGVGKTTLAANVAGLAAVSGWEVLAVDLDAQGNLGADLGYAGSSADDGGRALQAALVGDGKLQPSGRGIREGLDVVAGGQAARRSAAVLAGDQGGLVEVLEPVGRGYDLVVLDCPPAEETMVSEALLAAEGLVVPVRPDAASQQGLQLMARHYEKARAVNRRLRLLGVVLFGVSRAATAIRREVRGHLEAVLDGIAPVFEATIGYAERAAYDMRIAGQLAHEYEQAAQEAQHRRLRQLRQGKPDGLAASHYSRAAEGVAGDFEAVTEAILARLVQTPETASPAEASHAR